MCEVLTATEVTDIDGVKTGARRFEVKLRRFNGHLQHLPNQIQLGVHRGSVFYQGQPKKCRKCGSLEHLAASCTITLCRNCGSEDHTSALYPVPIKCNLCAAEDHLFRDCPRAYANRVKGGAQGTTIDPNQDPGNVQQRSSQELSEQSDTKKITPSTPPPLGPEHLTITVFVAAQNNLHNEKDMSFHFPLSCILCGVLTEVCRPHWFVEGGGREERGVAPVIRWNAKGG